MKRIVRFAPLLVLVAVAVAVFASGVTRYLSFEAFQRSEAGLRSLVQDHFILALAAYVAVYAAATAVSIPGGIILTLTGGVSVWRPGRRQRGGRGRLNRRRPGLPGGSHLVGRLVERES